MAQTPVQPTTRDARLSTLPPAMAMTKSVSLWGLDYVRRCTHSLASGCRTTGAGTQLNCPALSLPQPVQLALPGTGSRELQLGETPEGHSPSLEVKLCGLASRP